MSVESWAHYNWTHLAAVSAAVDGATGWLPRLTGSLRRRRLRRRAQLRVVSRQLSRCCCTRRFHQTHLLSEKREEAAGWSRRDETVQGSLWVVRGNYSLDVSEFTARDDRCPAMTRACFWAIWTSQGCKMLTLFLLLHVFSDVFRLDDDRFVVRGTVAWRRAYRDSVINLGRLWSAFVWGFRSGDFLSMCQCFG